MIPPWNNKNAINVIRCVDFLFYDNKGKLTCKCAIFSNIICSSQWSNFWVRINLALTCMWCKYEAEKTQWAKTLSTFCEIIYVSDLLIVETIDVDEEDI